MANHVPGPFLPELAAAYRRGGLNREIQVLEMSGERNIDTLLRGEADVTISAADAVYFAYQNSLQSRLPTSRRLRALAALHVIPVHLLVRADSGIRDVRDLRNRAVGTSSGPPIQRLVLSAVGVDPKATRWTNLSPQDAARLVGDGTADAALVGSYFPAEVVQAALRRGARLLPIEGPEIERMRLEYRFVRQLTIPADMYAGYPRPIHTIGVDTLYVCRSDLDEATAYELTKRLFETLPALSEKFLGLRVYDVEQAPATPIPLHEGAARYYREVELIR